MYSMHLTKTTYYTYHTVTKFIRMSIQNNKISLQEKKQIVENVRDVLLVRLYGKRSILVHILGDYSTYTG